MKIVNREDFLKLPEGTFFCKGKQWYWDNFSVKGYSFINDFQYMNLCDIQADSSDQLVDRYDEMLEKGTSYPLRDSMGRDGFFEEDAVFLIYEREDLDKLIKMMQVEPYGISVQLEEKDE